MGINKDQIEGRVKEVAGKAQATAGRIVGSESQRAQGELKKNVGKAQAKFGDVKEKIKDSVKDR